MENQTILFYKHDHEEIDWHRINRYSSCVIFTDQPSAILGVDEKIPIIEVPNIREAYWKFIDYYRGLFPIPVIAVTGTCGKTTTKEMIKHILSENYHVQATYKSRNASNYDLPYLLGIDQNTDVAVFETGVARPGDITESCRYFKPQIGIITNIGFDHLNRCKTIENYIEAKAEILDVVDEQGTLILNADDDNIKKVNLDRFKGRVLTFGFNDRADFRILNIVYKEGSQHFTFMFQQLKHSCRVPGLGRHNVYNAMAAMAAVWSLGVGLQQASDRLVSLQHLDDRSQLCVGIEGSTVINDTWSTNPTSIRSALEVLQDLSQGKIKMVIIGKLNRMGEWKNQLDTMVGKLIAEAKVDWLITVDNEAREMARSAVLNGMNPQKVFSFDTAEELVKFVPSLLSQNVVILIKVEYGFEVIKAKLIRK
ncbi:MAG TPA: UDP-N-acetylmuramoyl-tripeptide--D-alanyl-D-alanine ligase [Bacillota bacterium]|nr:UDP-N-acetylmuramoyl-tripeptide--D-alanyl-D-alanine ligase [Bacillota bacterium]